MKVLVSTLVAVLLLTVGGTAVAMADEEPVPGLQARTEGLFARVAEILGTEQEELVSAYKQVQQEMREECQATENCTIRQENENKFRQRWAEEEQEMGKRFQNKGTESQKNTSFRISQPVRGRQMIAVPNGWDGQIHPELADQVTF